MLELGFKQSQSLVVFHDTKALWNQFSQMHLCEVGWRTAEARSVYVELE